MQRPFSFSSFAPPPWKVVSKILLFVLIAVLLQQCKSGHPSVQADLQPAVTDNGNVVSIPIGTADTSLFKTQTVHKSQIHEEILAPARIVFCSSRSENTPEYPLFLFDSPDETSLYSSHRQNSSAYEKAKKTYERVKDLFAHQSASGKDVEDANADLATAAATLAETEGKLRAIGIDPALFHGAKAGKAWIITDIPESQLHEVKKRATASVTFTSYPGDTFGASVEAIGEVVDDASRTIKVRLNIANGNGRFKPGMYAIVNFGQSRSSVLAVPQNALVTVQGQRYLFVQSSEGQFLRRDVDVGDVSGDSAIILRGISEGDRVVVTGAMLLKGMSFGY